MNNTIPGQKRFAEFSMEAWREGFLRTVLYITTAIGLVGVLAYVFTSRTPAFTYSAIGAYVVLLAFTYIKMIYYMRAGFFMALLNLICLFTLLDTGIQGNAVLFYLGTTVLAALFYTPRSAVINAIVDSSIMGIFGWIILSGRFIPFSGMEYAGSASTWIQSIAYYVILITLILSGVRLLKQGFFRAEDQANNLLDNLKEDQLHLQDRVNEATRYLTTAAEVGRTVSELRGLDALLTNAVTLIGERFGLYYTQVYLLNATGQRLVLRAGTGEVGRQLLERRHSLPVDTASLNGSAVIEKTPTVVENTQESSSHRPNPLLPDTRSELVIPLMVREKVVGTLDMQSSQPGALNQANLAAFEALAGQLAVAVENATLLEETEHARATVEAQSRRLIRSGWQDFMNAINREERLAYNYDLERVVPLAEPIEASPDGCSLLAPIEVSGEAVGLFKFENEQGWKTDDIALVANVARQLGQQVENLRLLAQTEQYRNEAEQSLRRLTGEGWETEINYHPETSAGYLYDLNTVTTMSDNSAVTSEASLTRPMQVFGEKIGELSLLSTDASLDQNADLLEKITEQLSVKVENIRLFEETRRSQVEVEKRARQLAAVAAISTISSQELNIEKMLQSVVHLTQRQFSLYHTHIFLLDPKTNELKVTACGWREGDEHPGGHDNISIPVSQEISLVARAARTRTPVIVSDVQKEPGWLSNILLPNTASEMAIPLITGDQLLGVMDVQSDRLNAFAQEDANIQTTLASQVAIALQNARSFSQAQKQAERETLLNVIGQKIRSATTVEAVLQIAARELGHAIGSPLTIAQLGLKDKS